MKTAGGPVVETSIAARTKPSRRWGTSDLFERLGLLGLFAIVIVVFSILRPETFATAENWRAIATTQSVIAVLAIAMLPPLISGRFDVSVGANMTVCAIACASVMSKHGWPLFPAILFALVLGSGIGIVNGAIVAYFGVNSIIGTIGTATVMGGAIQAYTKGIPVSTGISPTLTDLNVQNVAGVPSLFVLMVICAVVGWYVLTQMPFGRYLEALGTNLSAARLTGLNVSRLVLNSFVLAGLFAGVSGVLLVATQGSASGDTATIGTILPALAAAFLGATTWRPGRYNVPGTVLALFFLGTVTSGLALMGTEPWVTDVFNGTVVVVAVIIGVQIRRRRTGSIDVGD